MRYVRSALVDAHQVKRDFWDFPEDWPDWVREARDKPLREAGCIFKSVMPDGEEWAALVTPDGVVRAEPGDWLVRDSDGALGMWRDGEFRDAHEPCEEMGHVR